jgi:hypothetical protein
MQTTLTLPKPLAWQQQVVREAARFNVVNVGRRAGKTILGQNRCATPETLSKPVAWFSPTYKMLLEVWRDMVRLLAPITARRSAQDHRLELITGGLVEFWSLDNPDVARGRKYRRVIVDEAAMVASLIDVWQYTLRPTLADFGGDAWFLSTPRGRNGFWQMYQWGQDTAQPDWRSWQMPSTVGVLAQSEIDEMRRAMPERVFRQEILAEFLEDGGGVFRRVSEAATATALERGEAGGQYVIGVDWGKLNDWTVVTVLDADSKRMVYLDRFNQIDYAVQLGRLQAVCQRFAPYALVVERNSIGEPLIEQLQRLGLPVVPFQTTNATKAQIIDALALAFEQGEIAILPEPVLLGELMAYEMERTGTGLLRYGAPDNGHDDCVMSLALAWYQIAGAQTWLLA